jgi:hypothetical protein
MAFRTGSPAIVLGLLLGYLLCACTAEPSPATVPAPEETPGASNAIVPLVSNTPVRGAREARASGRRAVAPVEQHRIGANQTFERPAWELVEDIARLSAEQGDPGSEEMVSLLRRLGLLGAEALSAIRDFMLSEQANAPTQQVLRRTLLQVLLSLDLPEVEDVAFELLSSRPSPIELWLLGSYLEQAQPGVYTESIRLAGEQVLLDRDATTELPGEFFQLLGEVGDQFTAALLLELPVHMNAYTSVALALIADGGGIVQLEQDARLFATGTDTNQGRLAVQLLAQEAYRQGRAADVLIELAGQNLVPPDVWPDVAALVSGGKEITLEPPALGLLATNTIYRPEGNQILYTVARSSLQETYEEIEQRIYLVGQLQQLAPLAYRQHFIAAETRLIQLRQRLSINGHPGESSQWGRSTS